MTITREQLHRHLPWLALGLAVPLLALLMRVEFDTAVAFKGLSFALPEVCYSRKFFGMECLGCGLTRSIIYLMHGKFAASYAMHRLGWMIFLIIIAQIPYRIWCLLSGEKKLHLPKTAERLIWGGLLTLLLLNAASRWF